MTLPSARFHPCPRISTRCLHLAILGLLFDYALSPAAAEQNVTIDDQNPSIVYSPQGAWTTSANSTLDFGGSHMLAQNPNATALFNFTGTAIYFFSPLWPYLVNTAISLDGGPVTLVDLVDHSSNSTGTGPETVQSHVVWNATGLNYTHHLLNVSVGAGQPFAILDGLIYTTPNDTVLSTSAAPSPSSTSSSSSISTTSTGRVVASPASSQSSNLSTSSPSRRIVPVALGTILGILGVFLLMIAMWFFCRKRQRPVSEAWTMATGSSARRQALPQKGTTWYKNTPTSRNNAGYPMGQTAQTWQNGSYAYPGSVPPPEYDQFGYDPNSRSPNRYQPGNTLSTITEKSTPRSRRTPLSANSPASAQSELGGASSAGFYSPPASPPSDVTSELSASRGAGLAGIGSIGYGRSAITISQAAQQQYYHPSQRDDRRAGKSGYSGSSASSTVVGSTSERGHGHGRTSDRSRRSPTANTTTVNSSTKSPSTPHWM